MQTIPFDIFQLLKKVKANHFVIPQFQRDFTWKDGQYKLLIDSIARGYPIGSLLLLGKNDAIPLKCRPLDARYPPVDNNFDDVAADIEPNPDTYYVLDGQQRLTSVALQAPSHNPLQIPWHSESGIWQKLTVLFRVYPPPVFENGTICRYLQYTKNTG